MTAKRRPDAPWLPPAKTKPLPTGQLERDRKRRRIILARTAKARLELDARLAGADMRSLAKLPISVPIERPDPPPDQLDERPPMAPPVPEDQRDWKPLKKVMKCGHCRKHGHLRPDCPELSSALPTVAPVIVTPSIAPARADALDRAYRCNYCGRKGHNIRSCPELKREKVAGLVAAPP